MKKYFNLTGLNTRSTFTRKDCDLLSPFVKHLREVTTSDIPLMKVLAKNCYFLTKLDSSRVDYFTRDLHELLSHSPKLRECTIRNSMRGCLVDPILNVLSRHCPLLEK